MAGNFNLRLINGFHLLGGTGVLNEISHFYYWNQSKELSRVSRRVSNCFYILVYHRVNDERDPFSIDAIPTELFEQQMAYLCKNFTVLPLETLVKQANNGTLPRNGVAITFDDGYRDNYLHAFPILKKYAVPATIFLTTGHVSSDKLLWFDVVLRAFKDTKQLFLEIAELPKPLELKTLKMRTIAAHQVLKILREIPDHIRENTILEILKGLGTSEGRSDPNVMLTWDQVREMRRNEIDIGSHTVSHPILSRCAPNQVKVELTHSKKIIEEEIGHEIEAFAIPSGRPIDYSDFTVKMVEESGYKFALTTSRGTNSQGENPWLLRRNSPWGENLARFAFNIGQGKFIDPSYG